MVDISQRVEVTVRVSAFSMGQSFAAMSSEDQAQFFNGIATGIKEFDRPACFQWQAMRDAMDGLPAALDCFNAMAEYAGDFTPPPRSSADTRR